MGAISQRRQQWGKFLPFNTNAPNPIKAQVGRPTTLEPVTLKETAKTDRACRIGIELEVGGWGAGGVEEEGMLVPIGKKNLPHIYVLKELPIEADVVKATGDPSGQIDYALKEGSARNDYLTCKLKGAH